MKINKLKPKVKVKKKDDNIIKFDYMKTNKDNIMNVINYPAHINTINDIVVKVNKIVIHTYQFLKLYLIHLYNNKKNFPLINEDFISYIFMVLTIRKCGSGGYTESTMPKQLKELTKFYNKYYKSLMANDEVIYYDKLNYVLAYEAIDIEKNINVNISEHFIQHLYKYINITLEVKEKHDKITKENKDIKVRKEKHREFTQEINKVKKDLTSFNELESDKKYHKWILEQRKLIYQDKTKFEEDSIYYDLKVNPQDYLKSMFYICGELEKVYNQIKKYNDNIKEEDDIKKKKQIRLFNVIPLRTNIISKNICMDSCSLISNFLDKSLKTIDDKKDKKINNKDEKIKNSQKYKNRDIKGNVHNVDNYNYKQGNNQQFLWDYFFRTNQRVFITLRVSQCLNIVKFNKLNHLVLKTFQHFILFNKMKLCYLNNKVKNKYQFNYMIKTDGISISILFVRVDDKGEPVKKQKGKKYKEQLDCEYIEKVELTNELRKMKIVTIDPNDGGDLIYCASKDEKGNLETFRYTQNQRRLETRTKKYMKITEKVNNETKINKQTIKQIESTLSVFNSKTVNYDEFKKYIQEKNKVNKTLYEHYQQEFFRKFKLNKFINMQKSEAKMVENFKNKFGTPDKVIIVFGDHDKGSHNMKGLEPNICKKFRRIFKNAGYKVYLINEFRTSSPFQGFQSKIGSCFYKNNIILNKYINIFI
jgi:predicted metallopeptidase